MKVFISILAILLAAVIWLALSRSYPDASSGIATGTESQRKTDSAEPASNANQDLSSSQSDAALRATQAAARRRSGNSQDIDQTQLSTAEAFRTATDLAALYEQLLSPSGPEDIYYRYRILAECNPIRELGIDAKLSSCESTASNLARENAEGQFGYGESYTASEIINSCFQFSQRCSNLNFDSLREDRASILKQALERDSVLARSSNLFQLSRDDPQAAREWLATVLNEQPSPDLLRNAANFLRSSFLQREQPFHGVSDEHSLQLAQHALDLTACRLEQGCAPSSHFMQSQCTRLQGCVPWQGYEEWLYQNYAGSPQDLEQVLQLSQQYQQFLLNGDAEALVFPEPAGN